MTNEKQKRLHMSEPPKKKKRSILLKDVGDNDTPSQKRKSLSGRELVKLRLSVKQKHSQQKQLGEKASGNLSQVTPSSHLVEKGKKPREGAGYEATSPKKSPQSKGVSTLTPRSSSLPSPDAEELSEAADGDLYDDSMNSTLPIEDSDGEGIPNGKEDEAIGQCEETEVISFPGTPLQSKTGVHEATPTASALKKTPMPTGEEKWLSSPEDESGKSRQDEKSVKETKDFKDGRYPSDHNIDDDVRKDVEEYSKKNQKKKQFVLCCENLPRGTNAEYLGMFFAEIDVEPDIRMAKQMRAGRTRRVFVKYAILVCKSRAEMDKLLALDGISMPSVNGGNPCVIRIVPRLTRSETKSNQSIHVSNINKDVSKPELYSYFTSKKLKPRRIHYFQNDGYAIVFLGSSGDVRRARRIRDKTLKGSELKMDIIKGPIQYDNYGNICMKKPDYNARYHRKKSV